MNGHGALLQTESLHGLALRGGRGRHLLATDGKVLNLILRGKIWSIFALTFSFKYLIVFLCLF